jgi:hypothetical protein
MELYNQVLADQMTGNSKKMINTTPQPTMFGGRRVRKYVLAGTSDSDYPSSLSVGSLTGEKPTHLSGAFWDGAPPRYAGGMVFNPVFHGSHGATGLYHSIPKYPIQAVEGGKFNFGKVMKSVGKVALPIATDVGTDMAKDALKSYMSPAGGRRGKLNFGKVMKSVGKVAMPIAKDVFLPVAKDMAKDALKSYMSGSPAPAGGRRGKLNFGKVMKSIGKVALPIAKSVGQEVILPVAKDMAKSALKSYMSGSPAPAEGAGRKRGRPKGSGGKLNFGKIMKSVGKVAMPIVTDVGTDMAKDALKSYMSPAGGRRGKLNFGKVMKSVGKTLGKVAANAAPIVLPVAFEGLAAATGNPEFAPVAAALGSSTGNSLQRQYGSGKRGRPKGGALLMNHPEQFQNSVYPPALQSYQGQFKGGRKQLPQSGAKRVSARGAIVAEVMKKHGLSLPQASSYVKQNGLY